MLVTRHRGFSYLFLHLRHDYICTASSCRFGVLRTFSQALHKAANSRTSPSQREYPETWEHNELTLPPRNVSLNPAPGLSI